MKVKDLIAVPVITKQSQGGKSMFTFNVDTQRVWIVMVFFSVATFVTTNHWGKEVLEIILSITDGMYLYIATLLF